MRDPSIQVTEVNGKILKRVCGPVCILYFPSSSVGCRGKMEVWPASYGLLPGPHSAAHLAVFDVLDSSCSFPSTLHTSALPIGPEVLEKTTICKVGMLEVALRRFLVCSSWRTLLCITVQHRGPGEEQKGEGFQTEESERCR